MEELRQTLLYTSLELETTKMAAQEEIKKREDQLTNLKELLNRAITERDEALEKFQKLLFEKLILQQHHQHQQQYEQHEQQTVARVTRVNSGVSSIESDPTRKGIDNSSSDCEESIVSSPANHSPENSLRLISGKKPLPEKGKLLEAVMKAGPLLQTLLLAGPLPQWRHPPPPLRTFEIPPVTIPATSPASGLHQEEFLVNNASNCGMINRKRGYFEGDFDDSSSPEGNKYQRVLLH